MPFLSVNRMGMLVNMFWQNGDRNLDGKRLPNFSCILFLLAGHPSLA